MPHLKAYDKNGRILAIGYDIEGEQGAVIIPNLAPHTNYPQGEFYVAWEGERYESEKVVVPEFTTHNSSYKEVTFYFKDHLLVNAKSAYDIAVDNGFSGTEEEWVKSIKGDKGDPGEKGEQGEPLYYSDLSEGEKSDLKSNITDQAVTDFVLKDGTVTRNKLSSESVAIEKTNFLKSGKNKFDRYNILEGKIISYTMGTITDNKNYVTSYYIPVKPNTKYTQSHPDIVVFFDLDKEMISGIGRESTQENPRTFSTPANAHYIVTTTVNIGADDYNYKSYQIEEGDSSTEYESYYEYMDNLKVTIGDNTIGSNHIKDSSVTLDKLSIIENSENIFDKTKATLGYYVNPSTGELSSNINYYYSDYVNILGEQKVTKTTTNNLYAFYDNNKNFITNTNTNTKTVNVPDKAVYIRISVPKANLDAEMLTKGEQLPENYVPYKLYIPRNYIEEEIKENDVMEQEIPDTYGKQNLKTYVADISKQLNPDATTRAEIAIIGDSWVQGGEFTSGDRLTRPLRDRMTSKYSDGGIGFISLANNHIGNGSLSVTLTGDWKHYDEGIGNINQSKGIDSAMVESETVGDAIKVQFYEDVDYYEIHTLNTGSYRYNIDGGSWTTVDATSKEVTEIPLTIGKHIINIEIVSGKVTFVGSYAYKGKKGVVIHKIGNGGLKASHIASTDRANWVKQLKRCKANTFGILLGTNDMAQSVPIADHERDMKEVISRIKEAKPLASIFLIAPSGNKYDNTVLHTIENYSDKQYEIAKEMNISYVSLYRTLGNYATTNANGLMYSDGVHPNKNGGYAISNIVYDRLLRL